MGPAEQRPLQRLSRVAGKAERLVLGLISGTSMDAAEAALCRIRGTGQTVQLELLAHLGLPLPEELQTEILTARAPQALCALNGRLGELFAQAGLAVLEKAGLPAGALDLVGSHGQTVAHLPPPLAPFPGSLQLGEASLLAQRLGAPVVFDFRAADLAVGGQGAPLVPYFDWAVLRKAGSERLFQNIGGIANLSLVGDRLEEIIAFDTGPGNMVLDALARMVSGGALRYDRDGELSAGGRVDGRLLDELLAHPYFARPAPKSAGREEFGESFAERAWALGRERPRDLMATAVQLTVESIARACEGHLPASRRPEAMYVSGGGCRHPGILGGLRTRLKLPVKRLDELGFPEAAKEAACFALLANEWVMGTPQNVTSVTGARIRRVLGKLAP